MLAAVLALGVVAAAVLAIRLSQGPITIDRFKPEIEAALQPGDGSYRVSIGRTEIAWEGWDAGIRIRANGLTFERADGTSLAAVPAVSLRLGIGGLMRGDVTLKEMTLWRPQLRMVRRADGSIEMGLAQGPRGGSPVVSGLLSALASDRRSRIGGPLGELEAVNIIDGELLVDDAALGRAWQAQRVEGQLKRDDTGIVAALSFDLEVDNRVIRFAARAQHTRDDGKIRVALDFKDLAPTLFASALGPMRALAWFDTPFGGRIELQARDSGRIESARFDLRGTRGSLRVPGYYNTPLVIQEFALAGALSENGKRLDIGKFQIRTDGPTLTTAGVFKGDEAEWNYAGTFALSSVAAGDIRKYWPDGLKPTAREWVTTNIQAGRIDGLDLRIALRKRQHATEPLLLDLVKGAFRFSGLTVRFMQHLPAVTKVEGTATFDDKDLKFAIAKGDLDGIRLTGGKVEILGFEKPAEDFVIVAPIEGQLSDILQILDAKPLNFASALGVNPLAITAETKATIRVNFPLTGDIKLDAIDIRADAELSKFAWRKGLFGLDLADGRFKMSVTKAGMALTGETRLADEVATLKWTEGFGKNLNPRRTVELKSRFKTDTMAAAGLDIRAHMSGTFDAELKIIGTDDGRTQIDGSYDFRDARFVTPNMPIVKPLGMPATGRSLVVLVNQRVVAVPRFSLDSPVIKASGSTTFHPDGVTMRTMELTRLIAGRTDLRATMQGERDGSKTVKIDGAALDLVPLFKAQSEKKDDAPSPAMRISARLARVYTSGDRHLSSFAGEASFNGKDWTAANLEARVGSGAALIFRLTSTGGNRTMQVGTEDAGSALKALNAVDTIVGGSLAIRATATGDGPYIGTGEMRRFRVIRAPAMARLMALASLEGMANLLSTDQGLEFSDVIVPFRFRDGVVEFRDGRAEGSQIGLTVTGQLDLKRDIANLRGTIVPFYLLNSIVGKIPGLGQVLVSEKGGGLFAAKFTITGDLGAPNFQVDPFTMLAPGPLRRLLEIPAQADLPRDAPPRRQGEVAPVPGEPPLSAPPPTIQPPNSPDFQRLPER